MSARVRKGQYGPVWVVSMDGRRRHAAMYDDDEAMRFGERALVYMGRSIKLNTPYTLVPLELLQHRGEGE